MRTSGTHLEAAGADFLLRVAPALHQMADPVEAAAGLLVLHVADVPAAAVRARGMRTVGLLGTRFTMTGASGWAAWPSGTASAC